MTTAILESSSKSDLKLIVEIAKKMGIRSRLLSNEEFSDFILAEKIEDGMKTSSVSRDEIMKALGK
ncbi:MAG: hypothetical protein ACK4NY_00570 [Spirosomataceae bacterium]